MEAIALLAGLALAINKTVSVLKALSNRDTRTFFTQLLVWVVGFAGLWLAANSDLMGHLVIEGFEDPLEALDIASLVLLAWILGGTGSFLYDFRKAIDSTDSAAETRLAYGKSGLRPPT